ncbi:uroporphyrinogen decarboxylase, partial [bacterium]|nr:uroporphyrinogen decarboxylase [bacterium]
IPTTYFARSSHHLLREMKELNSAAISLDWRTPIQEAKEYYHGSNVLQGNLDPTVLLGDEAIVRRETRNILDSMKGYPGHIFNLGHGILPMTPIQSVEIMLDEIRGGK